MGTKGDRDREARARERGQGLPPAVPESEQGLPPAPADFLADLNGPAPFSRPMIGRAFMVEVGPEFDRGMVETGLTAITGMTDGAVGFVFDIPSDRRPEVRFVFNPSDPGLVQPDGSIALAICRGYVNASRIVTGFDVVYGHAEGWDSNGRRINWLRESVKVVMHEGGHGVGLGHSDKRFNHFGPRIMGGAGDRGRRWDDDFTFHPYEREAWLQRAASNPFSAKSLFASSRGGDLIVRCDG